MELPLYFISDIHLRLNPDSGEHTRQSRLFRFFDHVAETGGTLFIVGDLFDFYFEYPHVIPKMYFEFYTELYRLKQSGVQVHYFLGNHDYWINSFMTDTLTDAVYPREALFSLSGKTFFITHGDGILGWDRSYRLLKRLIQSRWFVGLYRWVHPTIGYGFAHWIARRGKRYDHGEDYNRRVRRELVDFAERRIAEGADYVITGHYHQPVDKTVGKGKLLILGDWIQLFTYGYFDGTTLTLRTWETDETD